RSDTRHWRDWNTGSSMLQQLERRGAVVRGMVRASKDAARLPNTSVAVVVGNFDDPHIARTERPTRFHRRGVRSPASRYGISADLPRTTPAPSSPPERNESPSRQHPAHGRAPVEHAVVRVQLLHCVGAAVIDAPSVLGDGATPESAA